VRISRMLAAVGSAVRVLDAAPMAPRGHRGADPQALRGLPARDLPIITFVNKLDREGRDAFDLLDEIEQSLALDVTPASWLVGITARPPRSAA
jgi:peptide chain release factor 3